jgi:hypothetical protein
LICGRAGRLAQAFPWLTCTAISPMVSPEGNSTVANPRKLLRGIGRHSMSFIFNPGA